MVCGQKANTFCPQLNRGEFMEKVISIAIMVFSGYWVMKGWTTFGFWVDNGPSGGFMPVVFGLITFVLAFYGLIRDNKSKSKVEVKNFIPVLGALLLILSVKVFGMIVSSGLFIIIWLLYVEKFPIKKASIIGFSTTLVIYFVFKFFLKIPFPQGFLGI
jgi:putative tricarboxylic transport membrane protein